MAVAGRTITYGDAQVPLLMRPWKWLNGERNGVPYHRIQIMKPRQCWSDMTDANCKYTKHYVELNGKPFPVGVIIARELQDEGALVAVCTDLTLGRLRFINTELICVEPKPPLPQLLEELRAAHGGSLAGLPDAIGIFRDGRVALREAKVAKKDRLNENQHAFARAACKALGAGSTWL
jgi:hypothetical protein